MRREWAIRLVFAAAAAIHALPAVGVVGGAIWMGLYGITADPSTDLLLRHRAANFAALAVALLVAVFRPAWRPPVLALTLLSTAAFLAVVMLMPDAATPPIWRVFRIDLVLVPFLLSAWVAGRAGADHGLA